MSRSLPRDLRPLPRLIHQSWSTENLPSKFSKWSETCRVKNQDWEYVLWTDDDNQALVEKYFPWFVETYNNLPGVINRADVVRNMYMYVFGGVYADLDTECLRNMNGLFAEYNVPTTAYEGTLALNEASQTTVNRTAFLGRMGLDPNFHHSLPNAWCGSTPGHPFWLLVIEAVAKADQERNGSFAWPEDLTGPTKLFDLVGEYDGDQYTGDGLEESLANNPTLLQSYGKRPGMPHKLEILPGYSVYPFSWGADGHYTREYCEVNKPKFNPEHCKGLLGTTYWPSYTITYWSHSWDVQGHNEHNVDLLNDKEEEVPS